MLFPSRSCEYGLYVYMCKCMCLNVKCCTRENGFHQIFVQFRKQIRKCEM